MERRLKGKGQVGTNWQAGIAATGANGVKGLAEMLTFKHEKQPHRAKKNQSRLTCNSGENVRESPVEKQQSLESRGGRYPGSKAQN